METLAELAGKHVQHVAGGGPTLGSTSATSLPPDIEATLRLQGFAGGVPTDEGSDVGLGSFSEVSAEVQGESKLTSDMGALGGEKGRPGG